MIDNDKNLMNDDELESVSGGVNARAGAGGTNSQDKSDACEKLFCKKCNKMQVFKSYSGGFRSVCSVCTTPYSE